MRKFKGIGVSEGIGIGRAYVIYGDKDIHLTHKYTSTKDIKDEIRRLRKAIKDSKTQIKTLMEEVDPSIGKDALYILEAHLMILNDRMIIEKAEKLISEKKYSAEWSVLQVGKELNKVISSVEDEILQERKTDVDYVVDRIIRNLGGYIEFIDKLPREPSIVIARDLSPAETAKFTRNAVKGIVTELGSPTSHTAIIAKALQIPAVVGIPRVIDKIRENEEVIVEGREGIVIAKPKKAIKNKYLIKFEEYENYLKTLDSFGLKRPSTSDGTRIYIYGNIELIDEVHRLNEVGADGIGLYRTEYLYMGKNKLPTEKDHYKNYLDLVKAVKDKVVTIRILDIGGDKFLSEIPINKELNPALGLRAIRLCLSRRDIFEKQIRGILRASAEGNVRILIPLVTEVGEIIESRKIVEEQKRYLKSRGIPFNRNIKIGAMMETPSACLTADLIAPYVDFMSIGTNDLVQYTLAIDRVNESISYLYQPLHPAVLKLMENVLEAGKKFNREVSVCGEIAGDVSIVPVLIGMGFRHLSMASIFIPRVKRILADLSIKQCEKFYEKVKKFKTVEEINGFLKKDVLKFIPEFLKS